MGYRIREAPPIRKYDVVLLCTLLLLGAAKVLSDTECGPGEYPDVVSGNCSQCPMGRYKPEVGNQSCLPCPLDELGLSTITSQRGEVNVTACRAIPHIVSFAPAHSPVAGGVQINVSLSRELASSITDVTVAGVQCSDITLSANRTSFTCVTSDSTNVTDGELHIVFEEGYGTISNGRFYYWENPTVTSLSRYASILSGGILIKAYGQHMTSLVDPRFIIARIYQGHTKVFSETCEVYNDTVLFCRTPGVFEEFYHPLLIQPDDDSLNRRKRTPVGDNFNDQISQFYGGLSLDGVPGYGNLSEALHLSQITIFVDPFIKEFPGEGEILSFDSSQEEVISIWGRSMDFVCGPEDFLVQVGDSFCSVRSLRTNQLTCAPPRDPPGPGTVSGPNGEPNVVVHVGHLHVQVGYLRYPGQSGILWELIVGGSLGLVLILILITGCVCCWVNIRRRRKVQNQGLEMGPASDPNLYCENEVAVTSDGYLKPQSTRGSRSVPDVLSLQPQHMEPDARSRPSVSSIDSGSVIAPSSPTQSHSYNPHLQNRAMSVGAAFFTSGARRLRMLSTPRSLSVSTTSSPPSSPGFLSLHSLDGSRAPFMRDNALYEVTRHQSISSAPAVVEQLEEDIGLVLEHCLIDIERISLQNTLGKGYFGKVFKGTLTDENGNNPQTVAVKTVQGTQVSVQDVTSFLEEAVVMKDFDHPNVLPLLGVALAETKPYVILPYMEHGDLKSYVSSKHRGGMTVRALLSFGVQIAEGMNYLAEQKFVHRDLAMRNCMLNAETVVKIADFGLSRDIYKSDYYRVETKHRPLPVKWMAIESLTSGVFSSKSDVWSFGVLLWELLTRGCSPYADIDSFRIKTYLQKGYRLSQPEHAPDEVFTLMKSCWREVPEERPSFQELNLSLKDILEERDNDVHEYLELVCE